MEVYRRAQVGEDHLEVVEEYIAVPIMRQDGQTLWVKFLRARLQHLYTIMSLIRLSSNQKRHGNAREN